MMRISTLVIAIVIAAGCSTPIAPGGGNNEAVDAAGARDGTTTSGGDGGGTQQHDAALVIGDGGFKCRNAVTSGNTNGHHNPGMDCMDGCHNHGFTLAGTLYTSAAGSTIVSGATITVIDANGTDTEIVSQTNGNFYTSATIAFPITIYASSCPTIQMMTAQMAKTADTGCNQTGCHDGGASPGRIHLP